MVSDDCAFIETIASSDSLFRPSLFDDFVEYEIDRLMKQELKEQQRDEDDSNNNIKSSVNGEQLNSSNMLQAN
jgi:hypothetical protein